MQRRVEGAMGRWERMRAERRIQREIAEASPRVREELLAALARDAS